MSESSKTAEVIQAWLVARLSQTLGIAPQEIDVREPFVRYGLGSTEAVSLAGELAEWLERKLSPALVYEYPTIEALALYLAASPDVLAPAAGTDLGREEHDEPIAVIGIGCRFPGANNPDAFWNLLRNGVDAIREVPADRFDQRAFYDPDPAVPGRMNTRWGGFLDQVDRFDASFFGISPREALRMDPQQRLLLEVTWEALQDAGQAPERLAGSQVGVFIGISTGDYGRRQWNDLEGIDAYSGTGNAPSIAANRISYLFDFRAPSIAIDTACSSSLVAVHLACRSLRNGESVLAVAGGVNLILSPAIAINFTKAGAMAPDGRCKAFDARANGYVRSEGAGVVVLKPLSRAVADRDPIHAVIRGTAVNQDGRSNGLMAPNPAAQEAVLREACRQAGVSPGQIDYIEAHGTGTLLGDPIEAQALGAVLNIERPPGRNCALGSVKTNIGHLEAAAGIAGLIKVVLALRHRQIPPSLHFEAANPLIPFDELPLRVQTALGPWPTETGPALAGVSSFGFGGTNAHAVLEAAPVAMSEAADLGRRTGPHLLPLSARTPEALHALARAYRDFLAAPEAASLLPDICYTASERLGHHDHRLAVTGHSPEQLVESLDAFLRDETRPGLSSGRRLSARRRKLVFVFSGQGSQWIGMGRRLLEQEPVFRDVIERCDRAMRPYGDWSLLAQLTATDAAQSRLNEVDIVQPALFAIQIGLAALWRSWGVEPQAVVGHSLGEVAAAYVAGALSLADAVRVVCHRSRLFTRAVGQGAMAAVELSIEEARNVLVGIEDRVSVAASNGPSLTVLSGDPAALDAVVSQLQRRDIFCRMVKVDFAAHSPQMEPLRAALVDALEGLQPQAESVPIYSTVTGQVGSGQALDALYWARNMREPVLFSTAVQCLVDDGYDIFLEISPHPILLSAMQQGLHHAGRECTLLASLRHDEDERAILLGSLGAVYAAGYPVSWTLIYPAGGRCVQLPPYPWQREPCWLEASGRETRSYREDASPSATMNHPVLGRHFVLPHPAGTHFWESLLNKNVLPYLDHHRIEGVCVLPASTYVGMALAVAAEALGSNTVALKDIEFRKALFLPEGGTRRVQAILSRDAVGAASFDIYSRDEGAKHAETPPILHATGKLCPQPDDSMATPDAGQETLTEIRTRCRDHLPGRDHYLRLEESGIHYGAFFQSIAQLWRSSEEVLGEVRVPDGTEADAPGGQIHPAVLDAAMQVFAAWVPTDGTSAHQQGLYLPTRIGTFVVHAPPGRHLWCHARMRHREADAITGDVQIFDEAECLVAEIQGLRFELLGSFARDRADANIDDWLYELQWQAQQLKAVEPAASAGRASWLIFADKGGVGDALSALLEARGERSILVVPGDSYAQTDSDQYRIHPERAEDISRLFEASLHPDQPGCRGVVHLWGLDAPRPDETTAASLNAAQAVGCGSVLLLAQALARTESDDVPRLWVATQGAQAVGEISRPLSLAQSPMWGLGRVVAKEHPSFWGGLVDLDPEASPDDAADQLWPEISGTGGEDQVAFRQGRRYVGRLVRWRPPPAQAASLRWRTDGSYLISGGLGDLGLLVARWMVEQGARRLILLGRTRLPPRANWDAAEPGSRLSRQITAIRDLEALGASVHLAAVDVADEGELRGFLDTFRAEGWPPIRGVVHAAGILHDGLLVQLDAASLRAVLRPKVMGGWLLHRLLHDVALDFFVLFSSAGSVLGQPGQGNYAAANAFLDALAHHRHAQGRPALSINWGAWAGEGFAELAGGKRLAARLALLGISSIAPARALETLERLLGQSATQVVAVPVNWKQYREFHPAGSGTPLLSELAREDDAVAGAEERTSERRDALLAAGPGERLHLLQTYLSEQVGRSLGLSPAKLDPQQPLSDLGVDSLMAVELKNRIAVDLKVNVPVVKFLQGFSVEQVVNEVLHELAAETDDTETPQIPTPAPPEESRNAARLLASLDQLSDEQVSSLLTEMLEEEKSGSLPN